MKITVKKLADLHKPAHNIRRHSDKQITDIILVLFQFDSIFSCYKETFSFIFFNIIDIINTLEFHNYKLLKKTNRLNLKIQLFPSCIKDNIFQCLKTRSIIRCREYLNFTTQTMCGRNHSHLKKLFHS